MSFLGAVSKIVGEETGLESAIDNPMAPWLGIPRLHHLLPYESYDEGLGLFYNKLSTGFVFICDPLVGVGLDDQGQMANFFCQEKNLPEGTAMQFMLFASPKISEKLEWWETFRKEGIYKDLALKRKDFLEKKAISDPTNRVRDYKLLISYTVPGHITDPKEIKNLLSVRETLHYTLERMGMVSKLCDAQMLINELWDVVNIDDSTKSLKPHYNFFDPVSKQIFSPSNSYEIQNDLVVKDETYAIKSFVPVKGTKEWSLGQMDHMIGKLLDTHQQIPCPFILHYGFVVVENQDMQFKKLVAKRDSLEKALKGRFARWRPQIKEEYADVCEAIEQIQRGHRFIYSSLNFTVMPKVEELPKIEQNLQQIWQSIQWKFSPCVYDDLGIFMGLMPMTWTAEGIFNPIKPWEKTSSGMGKSFHELQKAKTTITREAQNMLPLLGEWKGQLAPGIPLFGRKGQIFYWNPFDNALIKNLQLPKPDGNQNVVITGASGSGKSFMCNELITTTLATGGVAIVFDKGESFKNICSSYGGHHIDFNVNLDISINPFTNIPMGNSEGEMQDRHDQMEALVSVIQTMCKPNEKCTSLESSWIQLAAKTIYDEKGNFGCVDDVREFLLNQEDKRAKDLGRMLWAYSKEGPYNILFNRPASINLKHDFIVIETQKLTDNLRSVITQMIMVQSWQRMVWSDRKRSFLFLVDEISETIKGPNTVGYSGAMVRTTRKYEACLVLATQSLTDFFMDDNPGLKILFEQSDWKLIFRQNDEVTSAIKEHPYLKEFAKDYYREEVLRSLMPARNFSEFLIYGKEIKGVVGRLCVDPYTELLYSTSPKDYSDVQGFVKQGYPVGDAVEMVLKQRGRLI